MAAVLISVDCLLAMFCQQIIFLHIVAITILNERQTSAVPVAFV